MTLQGRVALVTGAGSPGGIGFATAEALAEAGARVAITSTTKRIHDRLQDLGDGGAHMRLSPTSPTKRPWPNWWRGSTAKLGKIDILVNNAGMIQTGKKEKARLFHEIPPEEWLRTMDINLNTCFHVSRAVLPQMLRRKYGRIVNIASVTGPLVTNPRSAGYSTAKAAMVGLTRALAIEVAGRNVTVNAIGAGLDRNRLVIEGGDRRRKTHASRQARPARRKWRRRRRFWPPKRASYITGQMLVVDGGNSIQENKGP